MDESLWTHVALLFLLIKVHVVRAAYTIFAVPQGFLRWTQALVRIRIVNSFFEALALLSLRVDDSGQVANWLNELWLKYWLDRW